MNCPTEDRLQALVEGHLSPAELAVLTPHLDECEDCRAVIGAALPVRDDAPDVLGRYLLRRTLGAGGMGVVYEAFDPELDRAVALKVLRPELGSQALQERLVHEARSLARLSHPNVVSVYDIGRSGPHVFLVMDLIRGGSLRRWLATPRTLDDTLDVFEQAAEGLVAAHSVGLVHRDFKPENVLLTPDGHARVSDFGLAFSVDRAPQAISEGSPAYMAPEQLAGAQADARSDQFSYGVCLAEAVGVGAPRWLVKLIARATQVEPNRRFESVGALLAALRRGRRLGRVKRFVAPVAVLSLVALAATAWQLERRHAVAEACRAEAEEVAQEWNPAASARLQAAFERTESPLAARSWQSSAAVFNRYATDWAAARVRACEAARLDHRESEALFAQKANCLTDRRQYLHSVLATLGRVDAAMLERVPAVLQTLAPISACDDARVLALAPLPPKAAVADQVRAARGLIADSVATVSAGHYADGLRAALGAVAAARQTHDLPAVADALLAAGTAHGRSGAVAEARAALEEAASAAAAGHAEPTEVRAWVQLMHFVGVDGKHGEDGFRYNEYAEAVLATMPQAAELEAERLSWLSALLVDHKRFDEARRASERQRAVAETQLGRSHRLYAGALDGLAGVLSGQGKNRDALPIQQQACEALERELGTPHPQLALCLSNWAALQANVGDHEASLALKARALEMFQALPGHPGHEAMTHRNVARSLLELGRLDEAEREMAEAAALSHTDGDELALARLRGEALRRRGDWVGALGEFRRAVALSEKGSSAGRIEPLLAFAAAAQKQGLAAEAAAATELGLTLSTTVYGENSFRLAEPLRLVAEQLAAQHRGDDARRAAERAWQVLADAQVEPVVRARVQFTLARLLGDPEPARATELAQAALRDAAPSSELGADIRAWLEKR